MFRVITIAVFGLLLSVAANADPSFNCAKAGSSAEKQICTVPDLQWSDRQLARLYKLALRESGAGRAALVESQRRFIATRDTCRDNTECLDGAYKARFKELAPQVNVYDAFGVFEPEGMGGEMWIVRFGADAAFKILTVGGGGHTCVFDTDRAVNGGKGVIEYSEKVQNACSITIAPDGANMKVQTRNCSDYCGMRAVLDASYKRQK